MKASPLTGSARIQRRLAELPRRPLNFDPGSLADASPATGWTITDLCQPLPAEPPGDPTRNGSWQIARQLMSGYEFADPSIVRAYYDPEEPLEHRNMLLKLQAFGMVHLYVGVRVGEVYEETREREGAHARVWGWNYLTLEGHVEMGQMDWEVWKWLEDGRVEFRVHAISRPAPIHNPLIRLGVHMVRGRERSAFLQSTKTRMLTFTALAQSHEDPDRAVHQAADALTSRPQNGGAAHDVSAQAARRE